MRCCQIVPSLEEKHGGPSKSVLALSRALGALGEEVTLLSTHPTTPSANRDSGLTTRVFRRDHPRFLCRSSGLRTALSSESFDLVHHHSLWLRTLHYGHERSRKSDTPLIISPRGMMSDWAWQHRRWRKRLVRGLVHPGAFEAASGWHATSREEADEIRSRGFTQPVCVAPNGVSLPSAEDRAAAAAYWHNLCPDSARRPTAVFYSRLHRKKRVLELIDLWLQNAPADWLLLMVGMPEDYTPAQLETYVMRSSAAGRIRVYDGAGRPAPYAAGSLFLLPSHSENFGLVIAEAMAHGLPVLVTDTTPWSSVNAQRCGWCVPWGNYPSALRSALHEPLDSLAQRGAAGREHMRADFSWDRSAAILREFYREVCARRAS